MANSIIFSEQAIDDLTTLNDVIFYDYCSPLTAKRYIDGIHKTIDKLTYSASAFAVYRRKSVRQYGSSVRRVNYRKMAILYTVYEDTVYIHRIVPAGSIAGL